MSALLIEPIKNRVTYEISDSTSTLGCSVRAFCCVQLNYIIFMSATPTDSFVFVLKLEERPVTERETPKENYLVFYVNVLPVTGALNSE